jgi:hypothetical protein
MIAAERNLRLWPAGIGDDRLMTAPRPMHIGSSLTIAQKHA